MQSKKASRVIWEKLANSREANSSQASLLLSDTPCLQGQGWASKPNSFNRCYCKSAPTYIVETILK